MRLSIIIPAHNEADSLPGTVENLCFRLGAAEIPYEILVINDHSSDRTPQVLDELASTLPGVRWVDNARPGGFGFAIQTGLAEFAGDAVCIVMADASEDPGDIVKYYERLNQGFDCVFGTRFNRQSRVVDYPRHKLLLNRLANWFINVLFGLGYNDTTNAFKCYRREVIAGVQPILSHHFNITVELPLKAIIRGYSYSVVPTNWYNRTTGVSKLKIKEMGSRYLFIVLYVFLEKLLSRGDYRRRDQGAPYDRARLPAHDRDVTHTI
jgi:dolichol-phosphate mannosyltransferase